MIWLLILLIVVATLVMGLLYVSLKLWYTSRRSGDLIQARNMRVLSIILGVVAMVCCVGAVVVVNLMQRPC